MPSENFQLSPAAAEAPPKAVGDFPEGGVVDALLICRASRLVSLAALVTHIPDKGQQLVDSTGVIRTSVRAVESA